VYCIKNPSAGQIVVKESNLIMVAGLTKFFLLETFLACLSYPYFILLQRIGRASIGNACGPFSHRITRCSERKATDDSDPGS
jgi:hypothetical protein